MAITSTPLAGPAGVPSPDGQLRRVFVNITFDTSYPTGGYAITPATFGLSSISAIDANPSTAAHPVVWNQTTSKIQVYTAQGTEVANAVNLSAVSCLVEAIGF